MDLQAVSLAGDFRVAASAVVASAAAAVVSTVMVVASTVVAEAAVASTVVAVAEAAVIAKPRITLADQNIETQENAHPNQGGRSVFVRFGRYGLSTLSLAGTVCAELLLLL